MKIPRFISLKTPLLLDVLPTDGGEDLLEAMFDAAMTLGTRVTLRLKEAERFGPRIRDSITSLILRLAPKDIETLAAEKRWPQVLKDHPVDFVEIEVEDSVLKRIYELRDLFPESTVLSAVLKITKGDVDSQLRPTPAFQKTLESLFLSPFDILCITSDYDPEKGYYLTTDGVPAVHRFLVEQKLRHRFSIVAAGGIRSAADAQKTVQRGANGVKIDWPVLLVGDPQARQKFLKEEKLEILHEPSVLAKRIANLIRVWNVQATSSHGSVIRSSRRSSGRTSTA